MAFKGFLYVWFAMLIMFGVSVSCQECGHADLRGLLKECSPFLHRDGPRIDPSHACCDVVKHVTDLSCTRRNLPDDAKETVSMIKLAYRYVARYCKGSAGPKTKSTRQKNGHELLELVSGIAPSPPTLPPRSDKSAQKSTGQTEYTSPDPTPGNNHSGEKHTVLPTASDGDHNEISNSPPSPFIGYGAIRRDTYRRTKPPVKVNPYDHDCIRADRCRAN